MNIQDAIEELVIPRVETLVKKNLVLGDEIGRAILTASGLPMTIDPEDVDFSLKFKYSYVDEWIAEMGEYQENADKYPFFHVNARGVTYEGDVVTIPEMVLATVTDFAWTSEQKDKNTLNPILQNLLTYIEDSFMCFFGTENGFSLRYERLYNAQLSGQNNNDYIDAVLIKNTKVRIIKQC